MECVQLQPQRVTTLSESPYFVELTLYVFCRKSGSRSPVRRKRSPSPVKATMIHIGKLTRNVTKEHLQEIFSVYGEVHTFIGFYNTRNGMPKWFALTVDPM